MIKNVVEIFAPKNEDEQEKALKHLNETARLAFESELNYVMDNIKNDIQKVIYLDWWNGGSLWSHDKESSKHVRAKRYEYVSDTDWEEASGWIMSTVSKGMG